MKDLPRALGPYYLYTAPRNFCQIYTAPSRWVYGHPSGSMAAGAGIEPTLDESKSSVLSVIRTRYFSAGFYGAPSRVNMLEFHNNLNIFPKISLTLFPFSITYFCNVICISIFTFSLFNRRVNFYNIIGIRINFCHLFS